MNIPVYIINLDRSQERYKAVSSYAKEAHLDYQRVPAIDGGLVDVMNCPEIDEKRFRRRHGKILLPGEVGCYLSHLAALRIIAEGEQPFAIIVEDDVAFHENFKEIAYKLAKIEGWDIIKFANHRHRLFRPYKKIMESITIGRFLHGPIGSSAAYMVTCEGAKKLLKKLTPMSLPYDVALERGWAGFRFFSTNANIIDFRGATKSTIVSGRQSYQKTRLPKWKRLGTFGFRTSDYICRIIYSLMPSSLKVIKEDKS
ncbi:glycosyltransferase family 25 protein [Bartonella tamiae]|uniref:Glycosyl transferase family 25 domain-containing protein n=1 Tax=Bartonella tamiae Th239 TaxID=1094558 RepID=J0QWY5_9HYPH|nr:glycosyltransferase family 25 protein [Bartonella tamiae]EJF90546.1 hypothetical protein ME5_00947 [Bartonella tamiae Th239]EJF94076.1 hypothetical protein MEG_00934 [Bartonella tamiae Th307]